MTDTHSIASPALSARIAANGAELVSLRDEAGEEWLWQAGAEWPRHAPVLFPVVGRVPGQRIHVDGRSYPMGQHGFVRDSRFEWLERGASGALLRLSDSEATREHFPFRFELDLDYRIENRTLSVLTRVRNPGEADLPYSVGAHPGFRWPLDASVPKARHRLRFEQTAPSRARRIEGGFLGGERDLPVEGDTMLLSEALFADDALVFENVAFGTVDFEALSEDGAVERRLRVDWDGFRDLGVWSKPQGAPFLCIEPWAGTMPPVGWDGEFREKPGIETLRPGQSRDYLWRVTV